MCIKHLPKKRGGGVSPLESVMILLIKQFKDVVKGLPLPIL